MFTSYWSDSLELWVWSYLLHDCVFREEWCHDRFLLWMSVSVRITVCLQNESATFLKLWQCCLNSEKRIYTAILVTSWPARFTWIMFAFVSLRGIAVENITRRNTLSPPPSKHYLPLSSKMNRSRLAWRRTSRKCEKLPWHFCLSIDMQLHLARFSKAFC